MQEMATHKIFYRDCPTTLGDRVNFPFITSQESSIARWVNRCAAKRKCIVS